MYKNSFSKLKYGDKKLLIRHKIKFKNVITEHRNAGKLKIYIVQNITFFPHYFEIN